MPKNSNRRNGKSRTVAKTHRKRTLLLELALWCVISSTSFSVNIRAAEDQTPKKPVAAEDGKPDVTITVKAIDLFSEYKADPLVADDKYEGRRVAISGKVVYIDFHDYGVSHSRAFLLAGSSTSRSSDSVQICFNESCRSTRRTTVDDQEFKKIKIGDSIVATCNVEPVIFDGTQKGGFMLIGLSKCGLP